MLAIYKLTHKETFRFIGYDYVDGYMIVADSEKAARNIACEETYDFDAAGKSCWLDSEKTDCVLITAVTKSAKLDKVLMKSCQNG